MRRSLRTRRRESHGYSGLATKPEVTAPSRRGEAPGAAPAAFGHDLSRISIQYRAQPGALQPSLRVSTPGDASEREADRAADQVMRASGAGTPAPRTLQREALSGQGGGTAAAVEPQLASLRQQGGRPLPESTRAQMENRFGFDFSKVRLHDGPQAQRTAAALDARAFTVGRDVVFGPGQYSPQSATGQRLLAHELAHVVQQGAGTGAPMVQRQVYGAQQPDPLDDPRMHPPGAPNAVSCTPPSHCPATFCQPYSNESYARHQLNKQRLVLMAGIGIAVSSRVLPLWGQYLSGGAPLRDLSSTFAADFTSSRTTAATTTFLHNELTRRLRATPPSFPAGVNTVTLDLASLIGPAITQLGDPSSANQMNFNIPGEVPGNLAGGIGANQTSCMAGAQPSPVNDSRSARGTVAVTRDAAGTLTVVPAITYTVRDTIDLCPGDCGTSLEQIATVPMSQFEATGIAGDVPFTVEFPAPPGTLTLTGAVPPLAPPPTPKKTP